jgi:hypothetical protein
LITVIAVATLVLLFVLVVLSGSFVRWAQRVSEPWPLSPRPLGPAWVRELLPEDPARASAAAVITAALLGIALVLLGVFASDRSRYGWAIFVLTPFTVGFVAAMLASYRQQPTVWQCARAGALAALTAGLGFLALGLEGLVCLLMAIPITVPCAVIGGLLAFLVHARRQTMPTVLGMMLFVAPVGLAVEPVLVGAPPAHRVNSAIDIAAPPAAVWAHLVEFEPISAPLDSWLFRAGVAYPISASLRGRGVGAIRVCDFSTGRFVETIRVWYEGRRLMFTVDQAAPALEEWTPYHDIHPPHLDGYFVSESADFRLLPLPGGGTRLEGTSVYRNHIWPSAYWALWSEAIVTRVHRRVFEHVRQLAERDVLE